MTSGYKIVWTAHAISELKDTLAYLEENWTDRELTNFSRKLDHTIELISKNPHLFPVSKHKRNVRKAVVANFNTLYYWQKEDNIEILSIFSNRQNPNKINL